MDDDFHKYGGIDISFPQKMLLVQSQESLERSRRDRENTHGMVSMSSGGRWPVQRGSVRYDFEEVYEEVGDKEEYDFEIEFPM